MIKKKTYRNGKSHNKEANVTLKKNTKSLQSLSLLSPLSCQQLKIFLKFFFFNLRIITFFSNHDPKIRGIIKNSAPRSSHYKRHPWLKTRRGSRSGNIEAPTHTLDRQSSQSSGKGLHHRLVLLQEPPLKIRALSSKPTRKASFLSLGLSEANSPWKIPCCSLNSPVHALILLFLYLFPSLMYNIKSYHLIV